MRLLFKREKSPKNHAKEEVQMLEKIFFILEEKFRDYLKIENSRSKLM